MGPHLQARTWSLLPILWVKFAMIKVFATWLLEADLPSPLRNGSHKMEYRQNAAGSAGSNNTYTACKAEECGCFNNWKKHHKLLLGILNVTKLSFFFMCIPIPTGPEMVQVIKGKSFGGRVLSHLQQVTPETRKDL